MPVDPLFAEISPFLVTLLRTFRGKDWSERAMAEGLPAEAAELAELARQAGGSREP